MSTKSEFSSTYSGTNLDLALGTAGARLVELIRRQSAHPDREPFEHPGEHVIDKILKAADVRLNPEQYHNNRHVDGDVVFDVAVHAGFVKPEILMAENELEAKLGIYSKPKYCSKSVGAIVILGAAGLSNLKRLYHAIKALKTSAVKTEHIIFASGQRATSESERAKVLNAGFAPADTEYESCKKAVLDLLGIEPYELSGSSGSCTGDGLIKRVSKAETLGVTIHITETAFNPSRKLKNNQLATRANTQETLSYVRNTISQNELLYVISHDIWQPVQELFVYRELPEYSIVGSGPWNLDRVFIDQTTGELKLSSPSDVQDEMRKYLEELCKIHPATMGKQSYY